MFPKITVFGPSETNLKYIEKGHVTIAETRANPQFLKSMSMSRVGKNDKIMVYVTKINSIRLFINAISIFTYVRHFPKITFFIILFVAEYSSFGVDKVVIIIMRVCHESGFFDISTTIVNLFFYPNINVSTSLHYVGATAFVRDVADNMFLFTKGEGSFFLDKHLSGSYFS